MKKLSPGRPVPLKHEGGKVGLKGWLLDTIEDNDILDAMQKRMDELVLAAAGEALSIVMEQGDAMAYISFSKKKLVARIEVPLAGEDHDPAFLVDIETAIREEIEYAKDPRDIEQIKKVRAIRDRLRVLASACDMVIPDAP